MASHLSPVPDHDPSTQDEAEGQPKQDAQSRPRTSHPLPSDRVAYSRQLEILRAFAVAAAENGGAASNENVGKLVRMAHTTVALVTPFLVDSGFLVRGDRGRLRPTQEVIEYSRAHQWTPDRAGHHLAPIAARSWWGTAILPRVNVTPRDPEDILAALSSASEATPDHRQQLVQIIDYAVLTGIVARQGNRLAAGRLDGSAIPAEPDPAGATATQPTPPPAKPEPGTGVPGVSTGYAQDPTSGYVEFHVDVRVRTSEFATWRPERISAFFGGIAQVLAAKGRMEADDSSGS